MLLTKFEHELHKFARIDLGIAMLAFKTSPLPIAIGTLRRIGSQNRYFKLITDTIKFEYEFHEFSRINLGIAILAFKTSPQPSPKERELKLD